MKYPVSDTGAPKMQIEKRRSNGGFLHFFNWNSKSRKKLFSNGGDIPGRSSQVVEDRELSANTRIMNAANGIGANPGNEINNDWNCASSETSNDRYESRALGVVARLMGLDSLPSSSVTDHASTSSDGFQLIKVSSDSLTDEYDPIDYIGSSSRLTGITSVLVEAKVQKVHNWPLERFQTEVLPPKSAKPISTARHRLFSPIRSPGNFPGKNPEYIIKAAAKILEASPHVTGDRVKSSISASVPLRIQDLKAKLEVAYEASKCQLRLEPNSVRNVRRKPTGREYSGLEDTHDSRTAAVPLKKSNSYGWRYKGKPPMTLGQAKATVQRREERSRLGQRNIDKSGDQKEGNSNQIPGRQLRVQRTTQSKPPMNKRTMVLHQNNQKQNSILNGPYSTSRSLGSNHQLPRAHSANGYKSVNMVNTKYAQSKAKKPPNARNAYSSSRMNPRPLNKGSSLDSRTMPSIATNILSANDAVSRGKNDDKKGMDVISFTFNSPIKKCSRETVSDGQNLGKNCRDAASNVDNSKLSLRGSTSSSPTQRIIDGKSLSILLEQKLRELTGRIKSSDFDTATQESLCNSTRSMEEIASAVISELTSADHVECFQEVPYENMNSPFSFVSSSIKDGGLRDLEGVSTTATGSGTRKEVDFQQPSPVSILESLFESISPNGISPNDESKEWPSSSPGDHEMFKRLWKRGFLAPDDESEFSYSSCSSFRTEFYSKNAVSYSMSSNGSRNWELAYIKDVMDNVGLILAEVLLIPKKESECLSQFEEMEDQMNRMCEYKNKPKDRRKLLFDCAVECVESRCRYVFTGTSRSWDECARMFEMKKWFVDEVYREITSRKGIGDMLVDKVVDADMSPRQGKWIEFNDEMYEEGIKIGKGILVTLMDELVTDLC